mgnify:CR=1 FL=1
MRENGYVVEPGAASLEETALFRAIDSSMAAFGPFEPTPHLAVALSGGSDSMALVLLINVWARTRGGQITALTVNHKLRPESGLEAKRVKGWMQRCGIRHQILPWSGKKPKTAIQNQARNIRYELIDRWCRDNHVLHVLLGHTADDQAETYLMRLSRKSGTAGLAGMPSIRELGHCRLLRPLLATKRQTLRNFLIHHGQNWLDDPSNKDQRYGRTGIRSLIESGIFSTNSLCETARDYGNLRIDAEDATDQLLASAGSLDPAGYFTIERMNLRSLKTNVGLLALGRAITSVGGNWYSPNCASLKNILDICLGSTLKPRTLGRCLIIPDLTQIIICREARNLPVAQRLVSGTSFSWDGRVQVTVGRIPRGYWSIGTAEGLTWADKGPENIEYMRWRALPAPVRKSSPVLIGPMGIFSAPLLRYNNSGAEGVEVKMVFQPNRSLSFAGFCAANRG